jgi:polysaccharide pyruvyl transferase WcaK-like protein
VYYHKLKKEYLSLKLLDWENFGEFLNILKKSEKVFTTRLHLFLVSYYLGLDVEPFVYQKKVEKMKQVLV